MDITELLNPVVEAHNIFEATDEDIFKSVMDAKMLREANAGGEDDNIDVPSTLGTCNEALQAALTVLRKYVGIFDSPFARKLEVTMESFGQQTRAVAMQGMTDTKVTDYFPRKWLHGNYYSNILARGPC
ncbi:hypothetical protein BU15DRAFT_55368 [Melanogaster broomeanus]|nr:hypothetical protein BU15DRAFT_55368 [Melanogaster broomeanus]